MAMDLAASELAIASLNREIAGLERELSDLDESVQEAHTRARRGKILGLALLPVAVLWTISWVYMAVTAQDAAMRDFAVRNTALFGGAAVLWWAIMSNQSSAWGKMEQSRRALAQERHATLEPVLVEKRAKLEHLRQVGQMKPVGGAWGEAGRREDGP